MILTELPDLPPRPLTARVRPRSGGDFYRRWGRENCVVSGMSRHAEYGLFRQTLSIKCVAQGSETYFVDRRRVAVSDDTFLVLNEGRVYASSLSSPTDTYSFSIFFRPGFGEEVAAGLQSSLGAALENGPLPVKAAIEFDESLQHHNSKITPVLRFIQRQIAAGVRDENWLEEQCQFLLERLITAHLPARAHALAAELDDARWPQRAELIRRLGWAIDFMHAHLAEHITLEDIAAVRAPLPVPFPARVPGGAWSHADLRFFVSCARGVRWRCCARPGSAWPKSPRRSACRVSRSGAACARNGSAGARVVRRLEEPSCRSFLPDAAS